MWCSALLGARFPVSSASSAARCLLRAGLLAGYLVACQDAPAPVVGVSGGAAFQKQVHANPASEEAERQRAAAVEKSLNPGGLPVYSGPVGGVRGIVSVSGDSAPLQPELVAKI